MSRATAKLEVLEEIRREGLFPYAFNVTKNSSYPDIAVYADPEMMRPVEVVALKALSLVPHSEAYDEHGWHTRPSSRTISRNDIWGELYSGSEWKVPVRLIVVNLADGSRAEWQIDPRTFSHLSVTTKDFGTSTKDTVTPLSGEQREAQSVSWQGQGKPEERQVQPDEASERSKNQNTMTADTTEANNNKDDKDSQPARRVYSMAAKRTYGRARK